MTIHDETGRLLRNQEVCGLSVISLGCWVDGLLQLLFCGVLRPPRIRCVAVLIDRPRLEQSVLTGRSARL